MKKVFLSLIVILICIVTVGCSNKETKVKCSTTSNSIAIDMNFTYLDGKKMYAKEASMVATMDLSSYTEKQIEAIQKQDLCASFLKGVGKLEPAFSNCKQEVTSDKLSLTADLDLKKAEDKDLFRLKGEKKDIEKYFEGYECSYE